MKKYSSIQLLRAVAALMVVILHSHIAFGPIDRARLWWWPGFSDFGWLGVSLFFVISGFIIANVMDRPNFSVRSYFWHRFWRIYPLYWIVNITGLYFYKTRDWFAYAVDELGFGGMMKSFLIVPMKNHPFWEVGWSLEHEVLFYVIAAIVAPIFGLRALAVCMLCLGGYGMLFAHGFDFHLFNEAQFFFGAGVLAYLLRPLSWKLTLPVSLVGYLLAYLRYYDALSIGISLASVCFAIASAALIIACLDFERKGWRVPALAVLIGNASFSLYLWHWLVIPIVSRWVSIGGSPEMWRWVIVVLSCVAAIVSYLLIEKPLIQFSHRPNRVPSLSPAK